VAQSHPLVAAVAPLVEAMGGKLVSPRRMEATDVPLRWDGQVVAGVRLPPLHGALDRLIAQVERELGMRLADLDREQKQSAVAMLDDLGAFTLRKGVEDVADALGVSRFTVYNYLHAVGRGGG
jgi:HTH domain